MVIRKSISKKTRFEVLKRDFFTCQYCSSRPPKVALEIDHILPVSKGGDNDIDNLTTACYDCNRGKSNNELSSIPLSLIEKSEMKKIAIKQYKDYQKIIKQEKQIIEDEINFVEKIFNSVFDNLIFTSNFRISVKFFIQKLGVEEVADAMEISCNRLSKSNLATKYFCGVCWTKIKEK
jgi:hypothetical protein